jgi:hypothetical protein
MSNSGHLCSEWGIGRIFDRLAFSDSEVSDRWYQKDRARFLGDLFTIAAHFFASKRNVLILKTSGTLVFRSKILTLVGGDRL